MYRSSHCLQAERVRIAYERALCQVDHCKVICTFTEEGCIQFKKSLSLSSLDRSRARRSSLRRVDYEANAKLFNPY